MRSLGARTVRYRTYVVHTYRANSIMLVFIYGGSTYAQAPCMTTPSGKPTLVIYR